MINTFYALMLSAQLLSADKQPAKMKVPTDYCRVCCTVSISDGLGGIIGITACSGNIFTSCETAGQNACAKAGRNAIEALQDSF